MASLPKDRARCRCRRDETTPQDEMQSRDETRGPPSKMVFKSRSASRHPSAVGVAARRVLPGSFASRSPEASPPIAKPGIVPLGDAGSHRHRSIGTSRIPRHAHSGQANWEVRGLRDSRRQAMNRPVRVLRGACSNCTTGSGSPSSPTNSYRTQLPNTQSWVV